MSKCGRRQVVQVLIAALIFSASISRSAAPAGLRALREVACETRCELICTPDETLVSATCPGGTLQIERIGDSDAATCRGVSGTALALCMKH